MKSNKILYFLLIALTTLFLTACDDGVTNSAETNEVQIDSIFFTDDYSVINLYGYLSEDALIYNPTDSSKTKVVIRETVGGIDTLSERNTPKLISMRNLAREHIDSLDMLALVVVDLTMSQEQVNQARHHTMTLRALLDDSDIYVAFMGEEGQLTTPSPLSDYVLDNSFVSVCNDDAATKYLYRGILHELRLCNTPGTSLARRFKSLVVISDDKVWGIDAPMDPQHFEVQQQLLDFVNAHGNSYPVFYLNVPADPDIPAELSPTLRYVCQHTGGLCGEDIKMSDIHDAICRKFGVQAYDICLHLRNPDMRVYRGIKNTLIVTFLQSDSIHIRGTIDYQLGSFVLPVIVNERNHRFFFVRGLFIALIFLVVCYLLLQFLVPYISFRRFLRRSVARYTGPSMSIGGRQVADTCYYCKTPFRKNDVIVGHCSHTVHFDCWEENGCRCPEHGPRCPQGSHYFDRYNPLNPKNAPYQMRWILSAALAAIVAWMIVFLAGQDIRLTLAINSVDFLLPEIDVDSTTILCYRQPSMGALFAGMMVLAFNILTHHNTPWRRLWLNTAANSLLAALLGYLCYLCDTVVCTAFALVTYNEFVGIFFFSLYTTMLYLMLSFRTPIHIHPRMVMWTIAIGLAAAVIRSFLTYGGTFDDRELILYFYITLAVTIAITLAYDIRRSHHYFLRTEGTSKTLDIALYKWMNNNPAAVVTIGRSVDCNIQLTWDLQSDIAPVNAEIRRHGGKITLFALEDGVTVRQHPLPPGTPLRLYHGTQFYIGKTLFTYIEKDK